MTDDIVARLRHPPFGTETSERNIMSSAADEITRLRTDLAAEREKRITPSMRQWREMKQAKLAAEEGYERMSADLEAAHGLLREAHVKMVENNLWSNLRVRIDATLKGDGDE